jgi:hypothetical protein
MGSKLTTDIDGNPLFAKYIAGRRVVGGLDEGVSRVEADQIARLLGIQAGSGSTWGKELGGNVGRYFGGPNRRIVVSNKLKPDKAALVFQHELGHGLDDFVMEIIGPGGSRIPTDAIKKEVGRIYEDLIVPYSNTAGSCSPVSRSVRMLCRAISTTARRWSSRLAIDLASAGPFGLITPSTIG